MSERTMRPGLPPPVPAPQPGATDDGERHEAREIARTLRLLIALAFVTIIGVMLLHGLNLA